MYAFICEIFSTLRAGTAAPWVLALRPAALAVLAILAIMPAAPLEKPLRQTERPPIFQSVL